MVCDYKTYFHNKKITVMGLGLLGRGIGVTKFLAECPPTGEASGANLTVTDLKTKKQLAPALVELEKSLGAVKFKKINFVLGEHRLADFRHRDLVLKIADVPLDSPYVAEALKTGAKVTKDAALLCELRPDIVSVGVTGTRGKSTITQLIYEILRLAIKTEKGFKGKKVFLAGNMRGLATLPLIEKAKKGDFVVMELDSWQLQGFADSRVSPNVAVFTNLMPDHLKYYSGSMELYYQDKSQIFRNQKKGDTIVFDEKIFDEVKKRKEKIISKVIVARVSDFPVGWKTQIIGEHNRANITCAILAARALGVGDDVIRASVEKFRGLPGRLEYLKTVGGVKYYNDTCSTVPEASIAAARALEEYRGRIVMICGGSDKMLDYTEFGKIIPEYVKKLVVFDGSASPKILAAPALNAKVYKKGVRTMAEAVKYAGEIAERGDVVLLSPAAASFGLFKNEYDRGDQFVAEVKNMA